MADGKTKKHITSVGGQALIEGIMMNGPKGAAMSVRMPDGSIKTELKEWKRAKDKYKILGIPVLRGIVNFVETMIMGYKCLMQSAEMSGQLEEEENPENMSKLDRWLTEHMGKKMFAAISLIASVLAIALCLVLFFWLPMFLVDTADTYLFSGVLEANNTHAVFEGIFRMIILILYMYIVSKTKDIKRVFMYHGAEHKTIFCYEAGEELTVENVKKFKRFHPRCGTSFIIVIVIISIIVSSLILLIWPILNEYKVLWLLVKLLGITPLVVGLSYEFIKFAGRHNNIVTRILSAPGLWMQRITTKEPTDDIIEVGIEALKAVITENPEDDAV